MSYQRTEINQFKGLNASQDPALIDEVYARDILNFRMEKVGKLVSRDGYVFGLFSKHKPQYFRQQQPDEKYWENNGIVGIGEMTFSSKWKEIDTDRVMVYAVRTYPVDGGDWTTDEVRDVTMGELGKNHYLSYLFSPLTGEFSNMLLANYTLLNQDYETTNPANSNFELVKDFDFTQDATPQGKYEQKTFLYAPNRKFPEYTFKTVEHLKTEDQFDDDAWIAHYIEMNQYRHKLIVSDKINGDMLIEDEANRTDKDACTKPEHSLHMRPNCLSEFDIDIVKIDLRNLDGQENSDVKQGMALYKFQLPKMTQMTSNNLCTGEFSDVDRYSEKVANAYADSQLFNSKAYFSFLQKFYRKGEGDQIALMETTGRVYNDEVQIFTNANNNSEVDNLLGKLEFAKQEYTDDKGEFKEDAISDIYIWEEYQIPYYICSGKDEGFTYYRDLDRLFQKTTNAPRIKELTVQDEYGKRVPLGVWRYRFVWDFGDGIYSAPSADLNVPDLLWSAVPDNEINQSPAVYQRHFEYADADMLKSLVDDNQTDIYTQYRQKLYPSLVQANAGIVTLTPLGKRVFDLKMELYKEQQHRFGIKTATGYNIDGIVSDPLKSWDILDYADFSTLIVLNSGETVETKGIFWEGMLMRAAGVRSVHGSPITFEYGDKGLQTEYSRTMLVIWDGNEQVHYLRGIDDSIKYRLTNRGYLIIPVIPGYDRKTKYALCDREGRLRRSYSFNPQTPITARHNVGLQLVFPGSNPLFLYSEVGCSFTGMKQIYKTVYPNTGIIPAMNNAHAVMEVVLTSANGYASETFANDNQIYVNVVPTNLNSLDPREGYNDYEVDWDVYKLNRPFTLIRMSTDTRDTLVRTNLIRSEALDRIVLSGIAEIIVVHYKDKIGFASEYGHAVVIPETYDPERTPEFFFEMISGYVTTDRDQPSDAIPMCRPLNLGNIGGNLLNSNEYTTRGIKTPYHTDGQVDDASDLQHYNNQLFDNLDVRVYIPGTRFIGVEQLTSYFPSSLIHKSPRYGIWIDDNNIPRRAKGLKIFRTLATHNNDWDPLSFGLVDDVKIERRDDGSAYVVDKDGNEYDGLYYFDDVMDTALNFTDNPDTYDGLRRAIYSRFNIPINERVYYGNFTEIYQSLAPRDNRLFEATDEHNYIELINYTVLQGKSNSKGYKGKYRVSYKYVYVNEIDLLSPEKPQVNSIDIVIDGTEYPQAVVLYCLPSRYDGTIKELQIYRALKDETDATPFSHKDYKYIGKVLPEDEGIFVDDYRQAGKSLGCTKPDIQDYEDAVRWSEPFQPDFIKLNNLAEYRSGDNKGVRITGLAQLYGNLVVFKENSMHRSAIQAEDPPISRTDEISNNIGCIAPNSLLNIDNKLYFLSRQGFVMYDNNSFAQVDGLFADELKFILANNPHEYIRDVSAGYNPYTKEIYLNVPMCPSVFKESDIFPESSGIAKIEDNLIYIDKQVKGEIAEIRNWENNTGEVYRSDVRHDRDILGHIYVISLEKQYVTKFAYQNTGHVNEMYQGTLDVRTIDPRQLIRKYYTNSMGELRSGDILPRAYGVGNNLEDILNESNAKHKFIWAGIYIETPYKNDESKTEIRKLRQLITADENNVAVKGNAMYYHEIMSDHDHILDAEEARKFVFAFGNPRPVFPPFKWMPVASEYRSKYFTQGSETILKRIRKVLLNIFSKHNIEVRLHVFHEDGFDDRTEEYTELLNQALQRFLYPPTVDSYNQYDDLVILGTNTNILSLVPTSQQDDVLDFIEDRYGKAVRFAIEIRTKKRAMLNSVVFHWRGIHSYLQ